MEKTSYNRKCLAPLRGEWFVNQILTIPVQREVVLKSFKASKRSKITVNISFSSGLIQDYFSEGNIRNYTLHRATCWDQVETVQQADL